MVETINKMRIQWAAGDAIRDAGLTAPEGLIRHLDLRYGQHPENILDIYYLLYNYYTLH